MYEITFGYTRGSYYYIEWFDPETEMIARWFGSRVECERLAKKAPPKSLTWFPAVLDQIGPPPYDAATGTGIYD
jgi:hypothetical protein